MTASYERFVTRVLNHATEAVSRAMCQLGVFGEAYGHRVITATPVQGAEVLRRIADYNGSVDYDRSIVVAERAHETAGQGRHAPREKVEIPVVFRTDLPDAAAALKEIVRATGATLRQPGVMIEYGR